MAELPSAGDIIARLGLQPHPEGGHYRETFRESRLDANGRSLSTAIYFLLARGERSHWHRIDAVEIWHYYAGQALSLQIADDSGQRSVRLGPDLAAGEVPQAIVPIKAWQAAESTGDWTLVGCTVAPGFDFCKIRACRTGQTPRLAARDLISPSSSPVCNCTSGKRRLARTRNDVQRFPIISLAAIEPPPAISTAASAIVALGLAKPATIRNAVESSGVA